MVTSVASARDDSLSIRMDGPVRQL